MATRWDPIGAWAEWSVASEVERRAALVREGEGSPSYRRLRRRGLLRLWMTTVVLYAVVALVPQRLEVLAAVAVTLAVSATLRCGAFRDAEAARHYFDGWVDGRMALCGRLVGELETGPEALLDALRIEHDRDLEVLLDIRTTRAPDDLSGLEGR